MGCGSSRSRAVEETSEQGKTKRLESTEKNDAFRERSAGPGKVEVVAESAKINMYVRCDNLKKMCYYFVVVYTKLLDETEWSELDKTELSEKTNTPDFAKKFEILARVFTRQLVRFEVYRCRTDSENAGLEEQSFIGGAEVEVLETIFARNEGDGWCTKQLQSKRSNLQGSIAIWAEEDANSKSEVRFLLKGKGLQKTDAWKLKADPYALIYRCDALDFEPCEGQRDSALKHYHGRVSRNLVFHTKVKRRSKNPEWILRTSAPALADVSSCQPLVIEMWDWFRMSDPRMIGLCTTCLDDLHENFITSKPISMKLNDLRTDRRSSQSVKDKVGAEDQMFLSNIQPSKMWRGQVIIDEFYVSRSYTFYDFLRSGCEVVPIVAVDFTRSTGSEESTRGDCNDYATILKVLGSRLEALTPRKKFPAYGFGAKVPPTNSAVSHAFALNGDFFAPEVDGVEGLLSVYHSSLEVTRLHGPTLLQPIVDVAASWAQGFADVHTEKDNGVDMKYFVLLIVTDGDVEDQALVVQSLVECTTLPLSVIVVSVGDNENIFLRDLHKEVKAIQEVQATGERNFVRFVRFNDYRGRPDRLARKALKDLPNDLASYFKALDVKPQNLQKFEDPRGTPHPRRVPRKDKKQRQAQTEQDALRRAADAKVHLWGIDGSHDNEYEKELARRPPFLRDRYMELVQEIQNLDYPESIAKRVLKEGIADDSMDLFLDNLLHAGYGKAPTYKVAIEEVQKRQHQSPVKSLPPAPASQPRLSTKRSKTSIKEVVESPLSLPGAVEVYETQIVRNETPANLEKCTICLESAINVEFVPCGHRLACDKCTDKIGPTCPWCQAPLRGRKPI